MKHEELWKEVEALATKIANDPELAADDDVSVIVGIADNNTQKIESLCVSGNMVGVIVMISRIAGAIESEVSDDPKTLDGNIS